MSITQEMAGLLRETWPKCNLHGQITTAQRLLVHTAANELERLERERNALLAALKEFVGHYDGNKRLQLGNGYAFQFYDKALNLIASIEGTNKTGEGK